MRVRVRHGQPRSAYPPGILVAVTSGIALVVALHRLVYRGLNRHSGTSSSTGNLSKRTKETGGTRQYIG